MVVLALAPPVSVVDDDEQLLLLLVEATASPAGTRRG